MDSTSIYFSLGGDGEVGVFIDELTFKSEIVDVFSFTISNKSYYAEEGMTWLDWIYSAYNTSSYMIKGSGEVIGMILASVGLDGVNVYIDDLIQPVNYVSHVNLEDNDKVSESIYGYASAINILYNEERINGYLYYFEPNFGAFINSRINKNIARNAFILEDDGIITYTYDGKKYLLENITTDTVFEKVSKLNINAILISK